MPDHGACVCHTKECGLCPEAYLGLVSVFSNRSSMITFYSRATALGSRMEGGKLEVQRTDSIKHSKGEARRTAPAAARRVENLVLSEGNSKGGWGGYTRSYSLIIWVNVFLYIK